MARFEPVEMLRALERNKVRYILIGGLAATLHGSPLRTGDADICPQRDPENLDRLAAALRDMNARLRSPDSPEGVPFPCDARFLANTQILTLATRYGDFDLSFEPTGTAGYVDLMKNVAAGRPKDLAALPTLRTLLRKRRDGAEG